MRLPEKFTERMQEMLGEEYDEFLHSFEKEHYQALRLNPLKKQQEAGWNESEPARYFNLTKVSWEENGYYYTQEDQPGKHPLHEAGVYYIQEPSAMAVVPLLEVKPGEKVLDLCAAPGGKSTQIAGYLQGQGLLVANEIHPVRAKILSENMERMGVWNACVTNEEPTHLSDKFPGYFDKILVDAPCSGEGMFRKNEAACDEWSPENVELCADRQDMILDCAAKMLRPGGRIVYSTCTFAPAENEGSIFRFLQRHPEFALLPIDKAAMGLPEGKCDGRAEWRRYGEATVPKGTNSDDAVLSRTLRLWPHIVKGEGHFAAVLQHRENRTDENSSIYETMAVGGVEKGISPKDKSLEPWWSFWQETGTDQQPYTGIFIRFGDNLYLAPENMPSLKGLKVLRPGLHLGTIKKERFEPAHALALAVSPDKIRHICHLSLSDAEQARTVAMYLNGQTFSMENEIKIESEIEKGWYLITVDGFGLGWGKFASGIMKNHYPKGLRKP